MDAPEFEIIPTQFDEVLPVWKDWLWPGRESAIEPTNPLKYLGGYDTKYMKNEALFFKAMIRAENKTIGVISGHKTEPHEFRLRGTYVFEEYRGHGVAKALVTAVENYAKQIGCNKIWLIPRKQAFGLFKNLGYEQTSEWIDDEFEFGPNCFVAKSL